MAHANVRSAPARVSVVTQLRNGIVLKVGGKVEQNGQHGAVF